MHCCSDSPKLLPRHLLAPFPIASLLPASLLSSHHHVASPLPLAAVPFVRLPLMLLGDRPGLALDAHLAELARPALTRAVFPLLGRLFVRPGLAEVPLHGPRQQLVPERRAQRVVPLPVRDASRRAASAPGAAAE
jgi:hypothetical protein